MYIYDPKATPAELETNGLGILEATFALVLEELNGEFSININVPPRARNFVAVKGGAIVKADTPRGPQLFRLAQPTKTLDGGVEAFGWHISYDLAQDMILDTNIVGKTGAEAMSIILGAGISETRFSGTSDIPLVTNMRLVRCSILAALIGEQDNCFRDRWGGEIERDNFAVNMKSRLGADRGVTIRYRKNLTGLTLEENHDEVVNRIIPTGLTATDAPLLLPETYIDSDRIGDTPIPHVREAHFSDVQVGAEDEDGNIPYPTTAAAQTELRARVAAMYAQGVDLPRITASVNFIDLARTEEYKDYAVLETVNLGDTVRCVHDEYDVDLIQRVVSYQYNALAGKYETVILGDIAPTLGDTLWAQDIDLSALQDKMTSVVKQGALYNNVYINHEDGFVAEATISGKKVKAKFNASGMGWYDSTDKLIGGAAVLNNLLAIIAGVLSDDINGNCYAKIGSVVLDGNIYQGIFVYRKDYSTSSPVLKLVAYSTGSVAFSSDGNGWITIFSDGTLQYRDANSTVRFEVQDEGTFAIWDHEGIQRISVRNDGDFVVWDAAGRERLAVDGDTNSLLVRDTAGRVRMWLHDGDSYIRAPGATNHAVGADSGGPYYVKNGSKTYF